MLALIYSGVLQQIEITSLNIGDFEFAHRLIRIREESTKSRRERIFCYSPTVIRARHSHTGSGAKRYGNVRWNQDCRAYQHIHSGICG
jgi:integrase/recombinase XerD